MTEAARFDVAVLGAGPGGYAAAFLAADLGLRVALIDRRANPGGTCLFVGCIPSKALLGVAELIDRARHAHQAGVTFGDPQIDVERLRAFRSSVVADLTGGLGQLASRRNVAYIQGNGVFRDPHTIVVTTAEGERLVSFDHGIIATGSSPAFPPTLTVGTERVWDSTRALELPFVPDRLLVVGGGYIGLEMASVYAALGSAVSVVEMTDGLLPGADRDLVRILEKALKTQLASIELQTAVEELRDGNGHVEAVIRQGEHYRDEMFDAVLIATGRRPNTNGLGLEAAGVQPDERGFIPVDIERRTRQPHLFAIGDVAGQPMLAHKATHEGRVAAAVIAGQAAAYEPRAIPAVVFTHPEVAWAGLTEAEAKAQGRAVSIGRFPWGASGRARSLGINDGLTRWIADAETGILLGCGIVGPGAGELIAEATLAIEMGATVDDVGLTIHAHPTLSETLMEAADAIHGTATHIYRPRR